MGDYHIGKLIRGIRESKGISRKKLYYGLKKENHIYKIESGMQEVPKLLVDILLERMGLSTDLYGYEFSVKEYELFQCRADLLRLLEKGQLEKAERLCGEYERKVLAKEKYQQQYARCLRLLIAMERGQPPEYVQREAEQTLFLTLPGFQIEKMQEHLLGGMERVILAIEAEAFCHIEGKERRGLHLYQSLLFYLEENCSDLWEQERQLPPLVLLMARWLWRRKRYSELWICEKGIHILRNCTRMHLLEPLMELEMEGWEKGLVTVPEGESQKEWQQGLWALKEIREAYQEEGSFEKSPGQAALLAAMLKQSARGKILGETLRRIRKERGISVEQLSDGICEPETLRRIELGYIRPRQKVYGRLMKKLDQKEYAYHPFIYSDDYRMYECYQKILWYANKFEYEKADYELDRLEGGLDWREKANFQVLSRLRVTLKERAGGLDLEKKLGSLEEALEVTVPRDVGPESWPLSREEAMLWNGIAVTLEEMGARKKGIEILDAERRYYEQSQINLEDNKKEYMMVLHNLSIFLGREGKNQEALELASRGILLSLKFGQGYALVEFLYIKAWNMERIMEKQGKSKEAIKKSCFPILKQDFYFAVIMQYTYYKRHIQNHCESYYASSIE